MEKEKFLKEQIIEMHINQGKTIAETISQLKISKYRFNQIIKDLKSNGLDMNKKKKQLSETEKMYRKKIIDIICRQYLDYNRENKFTSILPKELSKMANTSSYELIYFTIRENIQKIDIVNSKTFTSHYGKIKYIMKIIENNIENTKSKLERTKKLHSSRIDNVDLIEIEVPQTKYKNDRTDLSNLLDE